MAEATEAVQRATAAVDDALMTDGDAFKARLDLRAANDVLQQAKARQQQADQEAAAQARRAEQQAIADQATRTQAAFEQALGVIEPVEGVAFDAPVLPPAVAASAADLARAQAALTAAQPALTAANAACAAVSNRIAPKVARLAEIAARRADGDERDGDAAEVSLLEQHLAHLNAKLAPLQGSVTEALAVVSQRREATFEDPVEFAEPVEGASIADDYASMGLTLRRLPLALLRGRLAARGVRTADHLRRRARDRDQVWASGIVTHRQQPSTASGVIFATLEDETGTVNIIVWPSIAEEQRSALRGSTLLTVQGTWQSEKGVHSLVAARLVDDSALLGRLRVSSRDFR